MRVIGLLVALLGSLALLGPTVPPAGARDPDWVFYTSDKHHYTSPWYAGAHRIMIPFGCTDAPYYDHDPRCAGDQGFHHGLDIAIPCGTKLYAGKRAKVVDNATLGAAYGENPVLLRNRKLGWDLVIGHTRKVFVEPGDKVHRGDVFALVSDSGTPDGCHLHFEQRAVQGGLDTAVWPRPLLALVRSTTYSSASIPTTRRCAATWSRTPTQIRSPTREDGRPGAAAGPSRSRS